MKKVVINGTFGGFSLSYEAVMKYAELKKIKLYAFDSKGLMGKEEIIPINSKTEAEDLFCIHYSRKDPKTTKYKTLYSDKDYFSDRDIERDDPCLVEVVKFLGKQADGAHAKLEIVEIPDDIEWHIEEYDGNEHVAEDHRTWS